jgi:hypothetical protein
VDGTSCRASTSRMRQTPTRDPYSNIDSMARLRNVRRKRVGPPLCQRFLVGVPRGEGPLGPFLVVDHQGDRKFRAARPGQGRRVRAVADEVTRTCSHIERDRLSQPVAEVSPAQAAPGARAPGGGLRGCTGTGTCGPGWGRPASADPQARAARLASGQGAVLCTPHAVSGWVARRACEIGREVLMWDTSVGRRRNLGDARGVGRVRLEVLLIAARGDSVHVVSRSVLGNHALSVEAVDSIECAEHDFRHHTGRALPEKVNGANVEMIPADRDRRRLAGTGRNIHECG